MDEQFKRNESAGFSCHFTQRRRGISVNVQHTGHAYIPSCSSACVFCMDSFMKRNNEVEENTTACVRIDSQ